MTSARVDTGLGRPPVIVLGVDSPIGLTLVRECGLHGLPVIALGGTRHALGLHSRYAAAGYRREAEPEALVRQLIELAGRHGARALLTVSESDIALLNRFRAELEPSLALLIPSQAIMARVINKDQCLAIARDVGIETPATLQVTSITELERAERGLRFPVVLKWANPHTVAPALAARGQTAKKTEYAHDIGELRAILARYEGIGEYPLIQEYCPGHGMGQMFLMRGGKPVLAFQHRRLHENPPEGGTSSLCRSVSLEEHRSCRERSIALLRALQWEGVAMVEYRHEPETGRYVLMEVNGRFWGSQPLAFHAGAYFGWMAVATALGLAHQGGRPYRAGLLCRYMVPETYRLRTILFQPDRIPLKTLRFSKAGALASYLLGFVDPRMRYYVFWLRDQKPFFADLAAMLRKAVRQVMRRGSDRD